ncbi:MAG: hypothetical protein A2747_00230 [Candidatus Yonathbacteria bacterium RIFCSPHIGHO2_01_FULL_44_41]|uniref:Uncharacterized protein n=1 Tax=Candidatus Yonathbacteria bacterium RIFCSPHIGHO2_02_FULL_44_14 TaxID=1802724 RepID=A0A1G2S821_9BACT|nr:MAG: hypothetical protein A2747_00230 [Candidatus Yonathbacteria bacterium RIFCSPHIGHO2_01_FULL_44_41]OHA81176.1 MAG: hypothetical protein A3B06_00295 [Candidatus Yonathbacteria bacterium RIFCSPLOWO2_01_FULL_43_20]OHA81206.1 MAG: hypothetical protein A3D51_01220 [Candidatus Yonathbacteria bacterium RIFCSPHIGHO2_02_FULL_44_14]
MIKLLAVLCTFLSKKWGATDRWLCINLHWSLRLSWCALWIRQDEFHPSLDSDYCALFSMIRLRQKLLRQWLNITRERLIPSKEDLVNEELRIREIEERLYKKYLDDLVRRKDLACKNTETPSLS